MRVDERVAADAQLLRGGRAIAQKRIARLAPGRRSMAVPIGHETPAGAATLKLALRDRAGNRKVIRRRVHVPRT